MIIVNFKTYQESTGDRALELALIHDAVARETGADIRIAVQALDLARIAAAVKIPVYAQHIDPASFSSATGCILPEAVKIAGGRGTLLNHSEKRLNREILRQSIEMAKASGLFTVVCAASPEEGATFLEFGPDMIAVEPPELIGGDISVSTAKPEIIENSSRLIGKNKLLVGAGVKNGNDVRTCLALGASGVLLASGVIKAVNPRAVLLDLISGLA